MKRLLLVEDDLDTAELTQIMLKALGYQVILASNGVEAVRKAVAELPDLIIMDIHMPVMDGLTAVAEIRKHPQTTTIPTLAATAATRPGDEERCLTSGFNHYIAKLFTVSELGDALNKLLESPPQDK